MRAGHKQGFKRGHRLGREKGHEQGRKKGRVQGQIESLIDNITEALLNRFNPSPKTMLTVRRHLEELKEPIALSTVFRQSLMADNLEAFAKQVGISLKAD